MADRPKLNAYINFDGNAREAFEFYESIFGGELTITTFGESPHPAPPEAADRVIHVEYHTDSFVLMGSDTLPGMDFVAGTNFQLVISDEDAAKMVKVFEQLSDGADVTMPMAEQFWGDHMGMLTDKFGTRWMVSAVKPQ
jgi:PhnB protein